MPRDSRKDKNVLGEFKSEEIAGHKFEDLDSVLQSLGEDKGDKKGKLRKTKVEKTEVKKKEKGRRSVEKEVTEEEEEVEELVKSENIKETEPEVAVAKAHKVVATKSEGDLVRRDLVNFQNNFNLASSSGQCGWTSVLHIQIF